MRTFAIEIAEMLDSLAQLVEQLTLNQWVEGSNPSGVTKDGLKKPSFLFYPPISDIIRHPRKSD